MEISTTSVTRVDEVTHPTHLFEVEELEQRLENSWFGPQDGTPELPKDGTVLF